MFAPLRGAPARLLRVMECFRVADRVDVRLSAFVPVCVSGPVELTAGIAARRGEGRDPLMLVTRAAAASPAYPRSRGGRAPT
jgi:hypothetical protein